ncbi:hypothetical protein AMATHDRAFT_2861 [Amanita thiersii Skay4041]|uniref:Uncharacterized protein n=1 Tax=Amanita thiersii Skay4041 TaxID=703135 RepID=A0A2A9NM11_9AGAR|nr:hypothetical protein AMATHDRAFT_2861 [Amanita thiersii Skay4041]
MSATQSNANIVAFPSVSSSLHTLPAATSMKNVNLHHNMYAARAAESEAKLKKALSKAASTNGSSNSQPIPMPVFTPPSDTSTSSSPPLMMKKKPKFST